jgi:hypothetical protein
MVCLIKVLDFDIKILYQRIKDFVYGKMDASSELLKPGVG